MAQLLKNRINDEDEEEEEKCDQDDDQDVKCEMNRNPADQLISYGAERMNLLKKESAIQQTANVAVDW